MSMSNSAISRTTVKYPRAAESGIATTTERAPAVEDGSKMGMRKWGRLALAASAAV